MFGVRVWRYLPGGCRARRGPITSSPASPIRIIFCEVWWTKWRRLAERVSHTYTSNKVSVGSRRLSFMYDDASPTGRLGSLGSPELTMLRISNRLRSNAESYPKFHDDWSYLIDKEHSCGLVDTSAYHTVPPSPHQALVGIRAMPARYLHWQDFTPQMLQFQFTLLV